MEKSTTWHLRRLEMTFMWGQEIWLPSHCTFLSPSQLFWAFIKEYLDPEMTQHLTLWLIPFKYLVNRIKDIGGITAQAFSEKR